MFKLSCILKKANIKFLLLVILLPYVACNTSTIKQENQCQTFNIDTFKPEINYQNIKHCSNSFIDSVYNDLTTILCINHQFDLAQSHLYYYQKIEDNAQKHAALLARLKGEQFSYTAKYDSAQIYFKQAIDLNDSLHINAALAESFLGMATNEMYIGNFDNSLSFNYKALHQYQLLQDSFNMGRVYIGIAIDHYYQKDYIKSKEILLQWEAYYKNINKPYWVAEVQSALTFCLYNIGDYSASEQNARNSLAIRRQLNDARGIAESLNNLALPILAQKKWKEAEPILRESLALMSASGDQRQIPIIRQNLANSLWKMENYTEAISLLETTLTEAKNQGQKDAMANVYYKLSLINSKLNKPEAALQFYKLHKKWSDSLYNEEKAKAISTLSVQFETEKKEQKIIQLNTEKKLDNIYKWTLLSTTLFIALVAILIIVILSNKNKKNKDLVAATLLELQKNEEELKAFTENIFSKNRFIEELETQIDAIKLKYENNPISEHEQVSSLYQLKILTDDDWTIFKMKFDKVYPGYINKLRSEFPNLAAGEQRQFLLIKLNIDNKECANMLGISIDSVKKNKYRLKKKFNLSEQDSLDEFVKAFQL